MKVKDIMEKNIITATPDTTYQELAEILYKNDISGIPIVDKENVLVGFVSERDIFRILYPHYKSYYEQPEVYADLEGRELKVREIRKHRAEIFMTKDPVIVKPDDPIMKAGALMLAKNVSRFPVVENGRVVGIISRKMIYRAILEKYLIGD